VCVSDPLRQEGQTDDAEMKISESIDDRGRWHQTCEVGFMCQQAGCTGSRIMSVYNEGNRSSSVFMLP